ncbi:MAG: hypothetical protein LBK83_04125 [Treponema sp.]|jgi:hypothetical protein|nr:hypothetical protein [Treponema sp.]
MTKQNTGCTLLLRLYARAWAVIFPVFKEDYDEEVYVSLFYGWYYGDGTYLNAPTLTYTLTSADVGKTIFCRVYAAGFTGYKESAPTATVTAFPPSSPTPLTTSSAGGTLSGVTDVHWYSFNATSGSSYTIRWEENGTNGTTAEIAVFALGGTDDDKDEKMTTLFAAMRFSVNKIELLKRLASCARDGSSLFHEFRLRTRVENIKTALDAIKDAIEDFQS